MNLVDDTPHQADPKRRVRLRWRARRGLLENDLILTRFLDRYEAQLSDDDVGALTQLLELSDNELMDVILARAEPDAAFDHPAAQRIITLLRTS
jgi:antitoxin CptB